MFRDRKLDMLTYSGPSAAVQPLVESNRVTIDAKHAGKCSPWVGESHFLVAIS